MDPWTEGQIQKAIQTAQPKSFVERTVLERYLLRSELTDERVLDFGCGAYAKTVKNLRDQKIRATGYDFYPSTPKLEEVYLENASKGYIKEWLDILPRQWDIILVGNVFNIQPTEEHLHHTLMEIDLLSSLHTRVLISIPKTPRYIYIQSNEPFIKAIQERFKITHQEKIGPCLVIEAKH